MTKDALKRIVGENIRRERIARNMTVDELAELLDLTPGFVGLIERGRRGATIHNLHKLTEIFEIDINRLISGHSSPVLKVSEKNPLKAKRTKITSLIYQMSDNELEFVIAMIKNLKYLRVNRDDAKESGNAAAETDTESVSYSTESEESEESATKKRRGRTKKQEE